MNTQIIYGILWIATILFATGFVGIWKRVKEDEKLTSIWEQIQDWANIAVRYAQDVGDNADLTGEEKRKLAINSLLEVRDKLNIDITDDQVAQLVRAAYTVMVDEGMYLESEIEIEDEEDGE